MIGQLKYITVDNKVGGGFSITNRLPYLILSAKKQDDTFELHPNNIIDGLSDGKYIDCYSAESDYYTRLLALTSLHIDISLCRTGETKVNEFTHVLIVEFSDPVNTY